jgi:hypothetical protein
MTLRPRYRPTRLLLVLVSLAAFPAALVEPVTATAGTMHVYTCKTPSGEAVGADGWTGSIVGSFVGTTNGCPGTGGLTAFVDDVSQPANATMATWTFTAPANMRVTGAHLEAGGENNTSSVSDQAQTLWWFAAPANVYDSADVLYQCVEDGCPKTSSLKIEAPASNLLAATHLYMNASCGGAIGSACPQSPSKEDLVFARLLKADITLYQASDPAVSGVSGSLLASGPVHGSPNILFMASDSGAGIYQALFQVDGHTVSSEVIDTNGGRCRNIGQTTDGTMAFLYVEPCKRQVSADLSFDTTQLADGTHRLKVLVTNATGDAAVVADTSITVENHALQSGFSPTNAEPPTSPSLLTGGPLARGACNGGGCDDQAHIEIGRKEKEKTKPRGKKKGKRNAGGEAYADSGIKLSGRLLTRADTPIGGAQLDVIQRAAAVGYPPQLLATTTTTSSGTWKIVVPRGPSREIQVAYRSHIGDTGYAAHAAFSEKVAAPISIRAPHRVSAGEAFEFRGKLAGGYVPTGGAVVAVEILYAGGWRLLVNARAGNSGAFHYSYSFEPGFPPTRYTFRATVLSASDYPFRTGHSNEIQVGVR